MTDATITEVVGPGALNPDVALVRAEGHDGTPMTLYYPADETPDVGREVDAFFEMGGWCTTDSPVYEKREGYDD